MWRKIEKSTRLEALSVLSDTGVVFCNFSAVQATSKGFVLVGTAHFNEAQIVFDEGCCRFLLRSARIHAAATDCTFDYETVAYIQSPRDEGRAHVALSHQSSSQTSRSAAAEGTAAVSLRSGIGLKGELAGKISGDFENAVSRTESSADTQRRLFIRADVFARGEQPDHVVWTVSPDPSNPLQQGGELYDVVHGRRFNQANEGAGLAYVRLISSTGHVDVFLEIRGGDIVWTHIDFPEASKLHRFKDRLINVRTKRDIVGRLALAKALEGRIRLKSVRPPG